MIDVAVSNPWESLELTIVIADDHGVLRTGLRGILTAEPDFRVVGEAASGEEALRVVDKTHPHILLADMTMPKPNGIELARILNDSTPETRVLILGLSEDENQHARGSRSWCLGLRT